MGEDHGSFLGEKRNTPQSKIIHYGKAEKLKIVPEQKQKNISTQLMTTSPIGHGVSTAKDVEKEQCLPSAGAMT